MHVERPVGADFHEGRVRLARPARGPGRHRQALQPVERLGDAGQEPRVTGQPIEPHQKLDVGGGGMRRQRLGLVGAGRRRLQVGRVLQRPAGLRRAHLRHEERAHAPGDGIAHARLAERLMTQHEKIDVLAGHAVVEGQVRRVVRVSVVAELVLQRKALRPGANRVLAVEDEGQRLVQRGLVSRVALLDVEPQQELGRHRRGGVVEGRVAPIVLELLHPPGVPADGVVPLAQRSLAGEVGEVVPSTRWMLGPDERSGHRFGGAVVVLVLRRVISVEEQVAHRRGAGRLDPDLRGPRLELAPAPRPIGQVGPDVAAFGADLLDHEPGRPLHHVEDLVDRRRGGRLSDRRGRGRGAGQQRSGQDGATCQAGHTAPGRTSDVPGRADRRPPWWSCRTPSLRDA